VRFFIGDTVSGSGPKPSGVNLSNEEIDALVTLAGSWQSAAALACRGLASSWMNEANSIKIGTYSVTYTDRARAYTAKAQELEGGSPVSMAGLFSYHGTNSDGDDVGHMFGKKQWGAAPVDWTD
jgi:hypothetical protein